MAVTETGELRLAVATMNLVQESRQIAGVVNLAVDVLLALVRGIGRDDGRGPVERQFHA